jgi:hypothetical protein
MLFYSLTLAWDPYRMTTAEGVYVIRETGKHISSGLEYSSRIANPRAIGKVKVFFVL